MTPAPCFSEDEFSLYHGDCIEVLREEGSIGISGTYHSMYACGYTLAAGGFHILNDICRVKPNAPPNMSGRYSTASHEILSWVRKTPGSRHCYHYEEMKVGDRPEDPVHKPGRQMRSVWSIPASKGQEKRQGRHLTQKPCALLLRVIRASSDEGNLVLDPFTGSSTAGLAASYHGMWFIGIDTDAGDIELSIRRYGAFRNRHTTHEPENAPGHLAGKPGVPGSASGRIP